MRDDDAMIFFRAQEMALFRFFDIIDIDTMPPMPMIRYCCRCFDTLLLMPPRHR